MFPLDWLIRQVSSASPYAVAVNLPYALAFAGVAAEVAWLARRPGPARTAILRSAATATTMALGALAVGVAYTAALRFLWNVVATQQWEAAAAFWSDHRLLGAMAAFIAWDASGWVYHAIGHRTRIGWAAHQPHHPGEGYDATLGLRRSWAPFHGLVHHPLPEGGKDEGAASRRRSTPSRRACANTGTPLTFQPLEAPICRT